MSKTKPQPNRVNHPKNLRRKRRTTVPTGRAITGKLEVLPPDPVVARVLEGRSLAKICRFARCDNEQLIASYQALLGCLPTGVLLGSNVVEMQHIAADVTKALCLIRKEEGMEMGVQVQRRASLPAAALELSVKGLRTGVKTYSKFGVSSITCANFPDEPDPGDERGFLISPTVTSLLFGHRASENVLLAQRNSRSPAASAPVSIEWFDCRKRDNVRDAVSRVFSTKLAGDAGSREMAKEAGVTDWMKWASERAHFKLQLLSMMPLASRLMAVGRGDQILGPALTAAKKRTKQNGRKAEMVLHPDGIIHFWFHEARRLGSERLEVPLIKVR